MPGQLEVRLTQQQQQELEQARDAHPKAYVREAAAAILKVAAGQSARQVALKGLLRVRDPESVRGWIERYQQAGIKGLLVSQGRGRKASFSPSQPKGSRTGDATLDRR
ncbi:MAG: helix-turn-helix domain-containing protein [Candidatus Acidiferrales bacterium]